jgi:UPF0755 protein
MRAWIRRLGVALLATAVLAGVGLAILYSALDRPGPLGGPAIVVIPKGSGVAPIAELLERHHVVSSAFVLRAGVRLTGNQSRLRAGEYEFPAGVSPRGVIDVLVSGRTVVHKLTIPEGATTAQAVRILHAAYGLEGELPKTPGEGSLLPDTYHYSYGDQRHELVTRMEQALVDVTTRLWRGRAKKLPLTSPQEAIILASIVERETGVASERALVAGVFVNRLNKGMALQSDPTVAYGVALKEAIPDRILRRPLTRADLSAPSPFNTYLNKGLPPEPIANPGREALEAVLNPAKTKALYFVADGNGGHAFANTLDEHNRNVRRWRRILKKRRAAGANSPAGGGPP